MHVYETRPITATTDGNAQRQFIRSSNPVTWKRLYIVDQSEPFARNEIITSEQLLERERFDIDLLKVFYCILIMIVIIIMITIMILIFKLIKTMMISMLQ